MTLPPSSRLFLANRVPLVEVIGRVGIHSLGLLAVFVQ